ncbi:hypothetical protein [Pseudomonas graminis]
MSNDVRGYIAPALTSAEKDSLQSYTSQSEIGIVVISQDELYNFPLEYTPLNAEMAFRIGDRPDYPNATYLIDYDEYSPGRLHHGFPPGGKDRLNILLDTLVNMIKLTNAEKMVVALTECNQIETIKKITLSELYDVIHADFEKYQAPPDTLYEITV